jgi:hypothetical protein
MNATELFDELRAQYPGRWLAANWLPSVIASDVGVRMRGPGVSKSALCDTDNRPNHALVAVLIRSRRIGRKCCSVWKPTLIKPHGSS